MASRIAAGGRDRGPARSGASRLRTPGLAALALVLALGCATTGRSRDREQEQATRRANSHYDLGADHLENGRLAMALREFLNAERIQPENPRIQLALGEAYRRKGHLEDAEAHLGRALRVAPDYHEARLLLSAVLVHQERYAEAIVQAQTLVDDPTFPGPWRALTNLGWSQLQLGRLVEARHSLELARDYSPRYWPALLDLGILELREGHHLEAIEHFEQTLALQPGPAVEAEVNYHLGEIFVSLGKRERAIGHLMAAVAQTPSGPWGRKSEEYLKLLR